MMATMRPKTLSAMQTIALTMRVALEHHDRGELQEASALYQEVLGIDPSHADALFLLGIVAVADGNRHAAVQLLRAAVRNRPSAAHMHLALAEALLGVGRNAAALHCYWRILSLEPESSQAYINVGNVLVLIKLEGGNDTAATAAYQRALVLAPRSAAAHQGLGEIERRAGNFVDAEAHYRAAIAADERNPVLHAALAEVLYEMEHYAPAADCFRRAILLRPHSPVLLHRLGDTLQQLGQVLRAEACHRRASELQAAAGRKSEVQRHIQELRIEEAPLGVPLMHPSPRSGATLSSRPSFSGPSSKALPSSGLHFLAGGELAASKFASHVLARSIP